MPTTNPIAAALARRQYWKGYWHVLNGLLASGMSPRQAIDAASKETRAALLKGAEDLKNA